MAEDDAKKWLSCLGWGCLTVVVLTVLGVGGCVAFVYKGSAGASSVAEGYLESVAGGRFEEAFATLGPGFADEHGGLAEFVAFEQEARSRLGACGEWRKSGTGFNRESGRSVANLTYQGSCEGGPVETVFMMEQVDGVWLIQDIRYREPGTMAVPTCADCGSATQSGARFCANCGAPVGGEKSPPDENPPESESSE